MCDTRLMDEKICAKSKYFEQAVTIALPLAFIGSGWLNIIAFVLDGHRNEIFRQCFVLGIQFLSVLLFLGKLTQIWKENPQSRKLILCSAMILLFFGGIHLWSLFLYSDNLLILKTTVVNGGYLVSAWCAALIIAIDQRLLSFLKTCRIYAVIISPVILYYCLRFYILKTTYGVHDLGVMSYMPLAYMLLSFCLFFMMENLLTRSLKKQRNQTTLDILLFALFSIAITLSATKGSIVCLILASILYFIYSLFRPGPSKSFWIYSLIAICSIVLFSTVLFPKSAGENRNTAFVGELVSASRQDESAMTSEKDIQQLTILLEKLGLLSEKKDLFVVVSFVKSGDCQQALDSKLITQEEFIFLNNMANRMNHTAMGARAILWKTACLELKEKPWTGNGPMSYQMKYGSSPHNLFLELGTDFGLPVMLLILSLGIWVFLYLIRHAVANPEVAAVTLYVLSFMPQKMLSGSLYSNSVFFEYGFCIILALSLLKGHRHGKKQPMRHTDNYENS